MKKLSNRNANTNVYKSILSAAYAAEEQSRCLICYVIQNPNGSQLLLLFPLLGAGATQEVEVIPDVMHYLPESTEIWLSWRLLEQEEEVMEEHRLEADNSVLIESLP